MLKNKLTYQKNDTVDPPNNGNYCPFIVCPFILEEENFSLPTPMCRTLCCGGGILPKSQKIINIQTTIKIRSYFKKNDHKENSKNKYINIWRKTFKKSEKFYPT